MKVTPLALPEVLLVEPKVFGDDRGFFFESFNRATLKTAAGLDLDFVQDNHSRSVRGVLRGLHYQLPPKAQGKLVRVLAGEIFDVAVDLRRGLKTFGKWVSATLSAENKQQLWVPAGFAHGFLTVSETADVLYKTTDFYAPEHERCIAWDDPTIAVSWPLQGKPSLSPKDMQGLALGDAETFA